MIDVKELNIKEYIAMIRTVVRVGSSSWSTVMDVHSLIEDGNYEIVENEYSESYYMHGVDGSPDLTDISTWSTFDGFGVNFYDACINIHFSEAPFNKVKAECLIYTGDNMTGCRDRLKFKAVILLSDRDIIPMISSNIEHAFNNKMDALYDDYLERVKSDWISNMKDVIISSNKY